MSLKILDKEQQVLGDFRMDFQLDQEKTVGSARFLEKDFMQNYLIEKTSTIGSPSLKVTASIFMKRYAFLIVAGLYAMSAWDKKLDLSPTNVRMEKDGEGSQWMPKFSLINPSLAECRVAKREKWREEILRELFADHIYPLMNMIGKITNIPKLILWENIAVYLFWLYEMVLPKDVNEERRKTVEDDFKFIFEEANGDIYGKYNRNPLPKYNGEKVFIEEMQELVRLRKTCCFSYKLDGRNQRCKTCPCRFIDQKGCCEEGNTDCNAVDAFSPL